MKKNILKVLQEYSEGYINKMIKKFQNEDPNLSPVDLRAKIIRFDDLKKYIPEKVKNGELVLPPKFTKPNPKTNKNLDPTLLDNYTFDDLEYVLANYKSREQKTSKEFYTTQEAELVKIEGVPISYKGNDIIVYEGSTYESCIKLNYAFKYKVTTKDSKTNEPKTKIETYAFCIGRKEPGSNMYYSYRFGRGGHYRCFYFVVDTSQSADMKGETADRANFVNWYHIFVIHVLQDGTYGVTDAVNQFGDKHEIVGVSWDKIGQFMIKNGGESGKRAWEKIKNLQDKFPFISPPEAEIKSSFVKDLPLNFDAFKQLPIELKRTYIQNKAYEPKFFNFQMFEILPLELQNAAINSGFKPTYNQIKPLKKIPELYAKYVYKRVINTIETNQSLDTFIPLPLIKYLKETEKEKLFDIAMDVAKKTDNDFLTFDYIKNFFGTEFISKYVNKEAENLSYLPPQAIEYITKPELKKYYEIFSKISKNWKPALQADMDEEKLSSITELPSQEIESRILDTNSWLALSPNERNIINQLTSKYDRNKKYMYFLAAAPAIIEDKDKKYNILSNPNNIDNIDIIDQEGNIVKKNLNSNNFLVTPKNSSSLEYLNPLLGGVNEGQKIYKVFSKIQYQ